MAGAAAIIGPRGVHPGLRDRNTSAVLLDLQGQTQIHMGRLGEVSSLLPGVFDRVLPGPDEQLVDLLDVERDSPNLVHSPSDHASSNGPSLSI